jgi:hypothetical protein
VRSIPDVFVELLDRGAELLFAAKHPASARIPEELAGDERVEGVVVPLRRRGPSADAIRLFRSVCDLAWSLEPAMAGVPWTRQRAIERTFRLLAQPGAAAGTTRPDGIDLPEPLARALSTALAHAERLLPPEPELEEAIRKLNVDEVFLLTRCVRYGPERDVIKVARRLGIPSAMLVFSWDNLSSKAVVNEHPDQLLVWNEVQAREAVELHGIPHERVSVVGAANFDRYFAEVEEERRKGPKRASGGGGAEILYLCSSTNVVPQEPIVLERWLAALRVSDDRRLAEAHVSVRPHPGKGTKVFESWTPRDKHVTLTSPHDTTARLASAATAADAVVALNTSAEIEAAIAGRPVLTFRAGADAPGQEGSGHFPYLLEANGGFVIDAPDLGEHLRLLSAVLHGRRDEVAASRAVERFVRPAGLGRPVSPLAASTLLRLVERLQEPAPLA